MKKGIALFLALALMLALAACGGTGETGGEDEAPAQEEPVREDGGESAAAEDDSKAEAETLPAEPEEGEDLPAGPAEEPAAEPAEKPAGSGNGPAASGGAKPAGEQNTAEQKPSAEQKPVQPQEPAQDETASQPSEPAAPEGPAAESVDLAAFAASLTADQETWPGMMAMEGEALEAFYPGLSEIAVRQCVVQMAMISASGDELALVEVENSADVQAVKDIFQARIDYQVGDGESPGGAWYPGPTEMWRSESRIVSSGNFVMLVAHSGADGVAEQFSALFA